MPHRSSESFGIWTSTLTDRSGRAAIIDRLAFNGAIIDTGSNSHLSGPGRPTRSISARLAVLLLRVRAPQARPGRCRSRPTVSSRGRPVRSHFADGAPTLEPTDINRAASWKHTRPPDSSRARLLPAAMRTAAERLRWLWPVLRRADRGSSAGATIDAGLSPTPSCPPSAVRRGAGGRFFEPSGRPGPGQVGFGAPVGVPVFAHTFLNPRLTQAGVSLFGSAGHSHGRRRSRANGLVRGIR